MIHVIKVCLHQYMKKKITYMDKRKDKIITTISSLLD